MQKVVCYYRVSTKGQQDSGLGLDAQRDAVERYVASVSGIVVATYKETESGKLNGRPALADALHYAKVTGSVLVIAKLDRLSRNAAFLLNLRDSGVNFIAADMPHANTLTIGVMALVAQQEAEAISKRTKEALQAAKRQGKVLGNPNGVAALQRAAKGNIAAVATVKDKADRHAADLMPIIESLKASGIASLGAIAAALNERSMKTPRGGIWHKTSVKNLLDRIAA